MISGDPRPGTPGPETPANYKISCPGGHRLDVYSDGKVAGAWLELRSPLGDMGRYGRHSLGVVSQRQGSALTLNYIQYRDGRTMMPRFALSVEADGTATVQVLMHGDGPEHGRIVTLPLEDVLDAIDDIAPQPR